MDEPVVLYLRLPCGGGVDGAEDRFEVSEADSDVRGYESADVLNLQHLYVSTSRRLRGGVSRSPHLLVKVETRHRRGASHRTLRKEGSI